MKKPKESKEFKEIFSAIQKWVDKNDTCFIASFFGFDKNDDVKEDRMIAYGTKEQMKIALEALNEELAKEKEDFVNW